MGMMCTTMSGVFHYSLFSACVFAGSGSVGRPRVLVLYMDRFIPAASNTGRVDACLFEGVDSDTLRWRII